VAKQEYRNRSELIREAVRLYINQQLRQSTLNPVVEPETRSGANDSPDKSQPESNIEELYIVTRQLNQAEQSLDEYISDQFDRHRQRG
jgi:Arc/MetJ-type ribon-helix-helix transcriptional regulator